MPIPEIIANIEVSIKNCVKVKEDVIRSKCYNALTNYKISSITKKHPNIYQNTFK